VTPSHPPKAATWLLKHLTPKGKAEVLVGDLLEDFAERHSTTRYWRQALSTILVGFVQELRSWSGPVRLMGIRFVALFVTVSIPILLPAFSGHRLSWLLFLFVLALVFSLFAIPLKWLEKRIGLIGVKVTENPIVRAAVGLIIGFSASAILFHHIPVLGSDTVFLLLAVPTLLATWFALYNWSTLFGAIADEMQLSRLSRIMIGGAFVAVGFALQHLVSRRHSFMATLICTLAALGCFARQSPRQTSKS
jgi:hypothetical protein